MRAPKDTEFERDDSGLEPMKFVFWLEAPLEDGCLVRVAGKVLRPRADGRYELPSQPQGWPNCFEIVRCAGPRYAPPAAAILRRAAEKRDKSLWWDPH